MARDCSAAISIHDFHGIQDFRRADFGSDLEDTRAMADQEFSRRAKSAVL
jgi:hypothetical protein